MGEQVKKIISLATAFVTLALGTGVLAAAFTAGNLVVYRVGTTNGNNAITSLGTAVFLDEYATNGVGTFTLVQSIPMPTNYTSGGNARLVADGSATTEGLLTRSADGRFLVMGGYDGDVGRQFGNALANLAATTVPHVVGLVDGSGRIDTTTVQTNAFSNAENPRSAASTDGTNLWLSGPSGGIRYILRGSLDATQLSSSTTFVTNVRGLTISSNKLYFSDASGGDFRVGVVTNFTANIPTNGDNCFYANLPGYDTGIGSPYAFALVNLGGGSAADTLYVANDQAYGAAPSGAILKWTLTGGTWVNNGSFTVFGPRGLAAAKEPSTSVVHIYVTSGGSLSGAGSYLRRYDDASGLGGDPGDAAPSAEIDPANTSTNGYIFRGVAFAPQGTEPFPAGAGKITVGGILGFNSFCLTGGAVGTKTYSIGNPGTDTVSWAATADVAWVTLTPSSGSLAGGSAANVVVSFGAAANSFAAETTNTATVTFTNQTSAVGTTTRPVTLTVDAQSISPTTDFTSTGGPGGPFSPVSKTYTLTNGSTAFNWTVNVTTNIFSLGSPVTSVLSLSGNLGAGAGTNITVYVNTNNANALVAGNYSDVISFSNQDATALIDTRAATLLDGFVFFFDDFSTFSDGDVVGQQGWQQLGSTTVNPLQITSGKLVFQGNLTSGGSQTGYKNFPLLSNPVVFAGMRMTVVSAITNGASYVNAGPPYIATIYTGNNGTTTSGTFPNYRLTARALDAGVSNYVLGARNNGQAGAPWIFGTTSFPTGTLVRVVIQTDVNGSNCTVYVNPTSNNLGAQTPYISAFGGTNGQAFTADPGFGSIGFSQYGNATTPSAGATFEKVAVSTNYADVYTFITPGGAGAPTASFGPTTATSGTEPLSVTFTNLSTGTAPLTSYWTFGDGASTTNSSGANVSHTYAAGTWTVSLLASNALGTSTATSNNLISVITAFQAWQNHYFPSGGPSSLGGADPDADGVINSNEFLSGFNPNNAQAYAHVISIAKSGANMNVTYLGASGDDTYSPIIGSRTNVLEVTTGAANGSYSNNFVSTGVTNILSGGHGLGTTNTAVDTSGATGATRYYRIRVIAP